MTALAAGKIGKAATDVIAVQLFSVGIPLALGARTAGFLLSGFLLTLLGRQLVP